MKDLQLRFGLVLLAIISVVSFMIGRSLRTVIDDRTGGAMALEAPADNSSPSAEEDEKSRI